MTSESDQNLLIKDSISAALDKKKSIKSGADFNFFYCINGHVSRFVLGGKPCPGCSKRIYHDKWHISPETAEARWAHKEARSRELDEVMDFLQ